MFPEAFTKLDIDDVAVIIDAVNSQSEGSLFDPLETTVLAVSVPFYKGYRFLDIADHATTPPLQRYVLNKGDDYIVLNWSYKPIYDLNERAPIALDAKNILDYIRFFFGHVRGRHGRFKITEGMDSIAWKVDPTVEQRKSLSAKIAPMKLEEKAKTGVFKVNAAMMLKETLFKVDVYVEPNGRVMLSDHEILIEELPVVDDVFGH